MLVAQLVQMLQLTVMETYDEFRFDAEILDEMFNLPE
jgi:hypothetical protein